MNSKHLSIFLPRSTSSLTLIMDIYPMTNSISHMKHTGTKLLGPLIHMITIHYVLKFIQTH